jgi:IclR family pca regulon transcriptional regulator
MNQAQPAGSLRRGLALLTCLGQVAQPLGLSELAAAAGLDKATTHRLAQTLVECGYLRQDPATRSYSLALRILDLGFAALSNLDVRALALPYMRALAARFAGASVSLAVLDGGDVLYIERISQRRITLSVDVQVGSRLGAHCSSLGKALLAALPPEQAQAAIQRHPLEPMTPSTITSPARLEAELSRIRAAGYAVNDEETVLGLRSLAAAIRGADGRPVAAINVAVSAAEVTLAALVGTAAEPVADAVAHVSAHLGWLDGSWPDPDLRDDAERAAR